MNIQKTDDVTNQNQRNPCVYALGQNSGNISRSLFAKRADVLPQDIVKSRSREIRCCNYRIALKWDRHLGKAAAEVPDKCQGDSHGFETSRDLQ